MWWIFQYNTLFYLFFDIWYSPFPIGETPLKRHPAGRRFLPQWGVLPQRSEAPMTETRCPLPKMARIRQTFARPRVDDVAAEMREQMQVLTPRIRPGMTVGLTVGSRGIPEHPDHAGSRRSSGARLRRVPGASGGDGQPRRPVPVRDKRTCWIASASRRNASARRSSPAM